MRGWPSTYTGLGIQNLSIDRIHCSIHSSDVPRVRLGREGHPAVVQGEQGEDLSEELVVVRGKYRSHRPDYRPVFAMTVRARLDVVLLDQGLLPRLGRPAWIPRRRSAGQS